MKDFAKWHKGPLPADTWGYGGVVLAEMPEQTFLFADFRGDHALLVNTESGKDGKRLDPAEILAYNNAIQLPPSGLLK